MSTTPSTPLEAGLAAVLDYATGKIVDLQRQVDALKAQVGSGGGTGTTGGTSGGTTTPTATWMALTVPALTAGTGWSPDGAGASVSGGRMTLTAGATPSKATAIISGVTPGKRLRVTYTVDMSATTGTALPYIGFYDSSASPWQWIDKQPPFTPTLDTAIKATTSYECTVPAGAGVVYVGAQANTGTIAISGIKVEQA